MEEMKRYVVNHNACNYLNSMCIYWDNLNKAIIDKYNLIYNYS